LVDVPELNYFNSDKPNPRGEIWIRGPTVTQGYYKNRKATYYFSFHHFSYFLALISKKYLKNEVL